MVLLQLLLPRLVMLVSLTRHKWGWIRAVADWSAGLVAQATDMAKQAYTAVVGASK
jgi:hypothetical protein